MSSVKRIKSSTGIYHVMMRGNRKCIVFEEPEDYEKFISIISEHKDKSKLEVYAYCLMDNHIHLLLKVSEEGDDIGTTVKRIGSRYAKYYNKKYNSSGHVFNCGFKSEPVEDERYFFAVARYIHQNPIKAGMCRCVEDYPYSSWECYFNLHDSFVNTSIIKSGIKDIEGFLNDIISDACMDISDRSHISDADARKLLLSLCGCESIEDFKKLEQSVIERIILELLSKGVYMTQLQRLTGISRKRIAKYRDKG